MMSEEASRIIDDIITKYSKKKYTSQLSIMSKTEKGKAIYKLLDDLPMGRHNKRLCDIKYATYINKELLSLSIGGNTKVSHYMLDRIIRNLEIIQP